MGKDRENMWKTNTEIAEKTDCTDPGKAEAFNTLKRIHSIGLSNQAFHSMCATWCSNQSVLQYTKCIVLKGKCQDPFFSPINNICHRTEIYLGKDPQI